MKESDIADVLAIENASFRESRPRLPRSGDPKGRLDAAQLREELARPWARLWVGRPDAALTPEERTSVVAFLLAWHVADELHILDIATHPDLRRRGFARELIASSLAYAREHKIRHLLLEVRKSNHPAIRLYRAVGFFAMGVRKRYYPDDEDAVEMVLALREDGEIDHRPDEVSV